MDEELKRFMTEVYSRTDAAIDARESTSIAGVRLVVLGADDRVVVQTCGETFVFQPDEYQYRTQVGALVAAGIRVRHCASDPAAALAAVLAETPTKGE